MQCRLATLRSAALLLTTTVVLAHGENIVQKSESPQLTALRKTAFEHYSRQDFEVAVQLYLKAHHLARAESRHRLEIFFLNNVAGSYFGMTRYQDATRYFQQALASARQYQLHDLESMAAYNLASILLTIGQQDQALHIVEQYPIDGSSLARDARLEGFLLQMNLFTRLRREQDLRLAYDRALAEADLPPPPTIQAAFGDRIRKWPESLRELRRARVFSIMGQCLCWLKRYPEAEPFVLEAFRLRSLFSDKERMHDALEYGLVLREQGQLPAARQALITARQIYPNDRTPVRFFLIDRELARTYLATGDYVNALPYLRSALSQARQWRLQVLPSDSAYLNFESYLNTEVQQAFLGTLQQSAFPLQQSGLAAESFWVAEEARFSSMRAEQFPAQTFAARFESAYWAALARLQALRSAQVRGQSVSSTEVATLESRLTQLELAAGLQIPAPSQSSAASFQNWRSGLPADETLFSYYLGDPYSLAWVVSRNSIQIRRIASRQTLQGWIKEFRQHLQNDDRPALSRIGRVISRELFGEYLTEKSTTPFWTMVVDDVLATLPIAALPVGREGNRFLVEDKTIRILPSALYLRQETSSPWKHAASALGDPIYNSADRRRQQTLDSLQLNRLLGSAQEVNQVLDVWRSSGWTSEPRLGNEATISAFRQQLVSSPDIIHVSTHVLLPDDNPSRASIALSPDPNLSGASLFSSIDLNSVRTSTKLVVLSGCSSASGTPVAGIGINSLARGFLIAGVQSVVATMWPTVDASSDFFPVFYRHLAAGKWNARAAAMALRRTQLEMIKSRGFTSRPGFWAAYVAISKG